MDLFSAISGHIAPICTHIYNFPIFAAELGTIDYNILIIRLSSSFGIHGSVLN